MRIKTIKSTPTHTLESTLSAGGAWMVTNTMIELKNELKNVQSPSWVARLALSDVSAICSTAAPPKMTPSSWMYDSNANWITGVINMWNRFTNALAYRDFGLP